MTDPIRDADTVARLQMDNNRLWQALNDLLTVAGNVIAGRPVRNADEVFLHAETCKGRTDES